MIATEYVKSFDMKYQDLSHEAKNKQHACTFSGLYMTTLVSYLHRWQH